MAKRYSTPAAKLRYMKDQEFEDEAALLLAEYGRKHGMVTAPPIPIDEIVELYLELQLTFDDMQQLFGVDDVHGALWVNQRRVGIDQRLEGVRRVAGRPCLLRMSHDVRGGTRTAPQTTRWATRRRR